MDYNLKQTASFILMGAFTLLVFLTSMRLLATHEAQMTAQASAAAKEEQPIFLVSLSEQYKDRVFKDSRFHDYNDSPALNTAVSLIEGIHSVLSLYENISGKTVPQTSCIENAYSSDDRYLVFAIEHGLLDIYSMSKTNEPLLHHQLIKLIFGLLELDTDNSISRKHINYINSVPDLISYSDIHAHALELCRMGIISTEKQSGNAAPNHIVTREYLNTVLDRLTTPDLRKKEAFKHREHEKKQFHAVLQKPELPTGCEVTSLTAVLNHMGYDVDKLTLADEYLDKGQIGSTDYRRAFVGNPRHASSYGCYAPVIVNCANKYLSLNSSPYRAYDCSGHELQELYPILDKGIPVIIWATISMSQSYTTDVWTVGTNQIQWTAGEHCLVLYGYDTQNKMLYVADPLAGNVKYSEEIFQKRYNELFKQAVIIK